MKLQRWTICASFFIHLLGFSAVALHSNQTPKPPEPVQFYLSLHAISMDIRSKQSSSSVIDESPKLQQLSEDVSIPPPLSQPKQKTIGETEQHADHVIKLTSRKKQLFSSQKTLIRPEQQPSATIEKTRAPQFSKTTNQHLTEVAGPFLPQRKEISGQHNTVQSEKLSTSRKTDPLDEVKNEYLIANYADIRHLVSQNLTFPSAARKLQLKGKVVVSFALRQDGYPTEIAVVVSSGKRLLDNCVVSAIQRAAPFPPPVKQVTLKIPVNFNLI